MNKNAMTNRSTIKLKTATGKSRCGFRKSDGYILSDYHAELVRNGFKVQFTSQGIIVTK